MLENFEQKKLTEYIINALNNYSGCNIKRLKKEVNFRQESGNIAFKINYITRNKVLKQLNTALKQYDKDNSLRQKQIEALADLYKLNNEESDLLGLVARATTSETIGRILGEMYERYSIDENLKFTAVRQILGNSSTLNDSNNHLYELGLLVTRRGSLCLSTLIHNLFLNAEEFHTRESIVKFICGNALSTDLKRKDFKHKLVEFDMLSKMLKCALKNKTKGINILLYGKPGTGKTEFAKTVANSIKANLFEVSFVDSSDDEANRSDRLDDLKTKDSMGKTIQDKIVILFDEAEDMFSYANENKTISKAYVNNLLETNNLPVIWITNDIRSMDNAYLRRMSYSIKFEEFSKDMQLEFLKKEFKRAEYKISNKKVCEINEKYTLTSSTITNAIKLSKMTNGGCEKLEHYINSSLVALNNGCDIEDKKERSTQNYKKYNFELVNTSLSTQNLTEKIKNANNLSFSLLLYGEPGTGKSEYAKKLAKELDLKVIFKRASDLKSKWVGETEKNIAEAFENAKRTKSVLIFDEIDSFLMSRNGNRASWEISEVNEILTQLETHNYPFIATTNFLENLDEACLRRFTFKIKFDYMTQNQVKLAYKHFFNKKANQDKCNIKGLTAGDFAVVKKKIDFLGTDSIDEIYEMLLDEVKVKKSKDLASAVGF